MATVTNLSILPLYILLYKDLLTVVYVLHHHLFFITQKVVINRLECIKELIETIASARRDKINEDAIFFT